MRSRTFDRLGMVPRIFQGAPAFFLVTEERPRNHVDSLADETDTTIMWSWHRKAIMELSKIRDHSERIVHRKRDDEKRGIAMKISHAKRGCSAI